MLSLLQMQALCLEIAPEILFYQVTHMTSSRPNRLFIYLQRGEVIKKLFLCLSPPFLRFHLIQNKFLQERETAHPLSSLLKGFELKNIEIIQNDRLLQLGFQKEDRFLDLICEFFPKRPNCLLVDSNKKILFSLYPMQKIHYQYPQTLFVHPSQTELILNQKEFEKFFFQKEQEYLFNQRKTDLIHRVSSHLKKQKKKLLAIENELQKGKEWEAVKWEGELLKANYPLLKKGMTSVKVWDWIQEKEQKIELQTQLTPAEEIKRRFTKSRKLKGSMIHLEREKEKIQKNIGKSQSFLEQILLIEAEQELSDWEKNLFIPLSSSSSKSKPVERLPYYEYHSVTGLKIWVGRKAQDNEKLTFSLANGSDWWLHVQDSPGSHVIIRIPKNTEPDAETLKDALQLALYHSKIKNEGEVCVTQKKFVNRLPKGKIGQAQISKHQLVFVRLDQERLQRLRKGKQN